MNKKSLHHNQPLRYLLRCAVLMTVMMTASVDMVAQTPIESLAGITSLSGNYKLTKDVSGQGHTTIAGTFTGSLEAGIDPTTNMPYRIIGLNAPLFETVSGTVKNLVLEGVAISGHTGNTGAIACTANGNARIYNVGILSGSVGGTGNTGGLVGLLDGTARVINCYSYANITSGGQNSTYVGGLVGNNNQTSTQTTIKTIVVNCMFYGEINTVDCSNYAPVYGNKIIDNSTSTGINPYDFFLGTAAFQSGLANIAAYKHSWPAAEEYLTRYEYYRSILNSNRQLMAWWVSGNSADTALIQKWVLDPGVAEYPILKKWGKYPSIINPDSTRTWNPHANNNVGAWQDRSTAASYCGKSFSTKLNVTVNPGGHAASGVTSKTIQLTITDMDTANYDYGYYKVQLPYYNEVFGNPSSTNHDIRFGGNYKDYVVTGWKITGITGGTEGTFTANWESGYNFADRYCTKKDLYSVSNRVFAQGGYYYVPEGVSSIVIEAYWGTAVYLHNTGHYLDRVKMTNQTANGSLKLGDPFTPTDTLPTTFQGQTVYDSWTDAVKAIPQATLSSGALNKTVYDQAIVLLSNLQWRNENNAVGVDIDSKWHPYTIMSVDLNLDNEPDYCFEFQYRNKWERKGIQPIRFDFLPVPELGMAVRHNEQQNTIGIFVPQGHFEITETSFMHTTQFEYDANSGRCGTKVAAPIILNGGHFEQIVVRYTPQNNTQYFLMGGHFRMLRFTPGAHANDDAASSVVRHCAVNCIGGDFPEFYLSGIYNANVNPTLAVQGNPHCYINGGRFGMIAGAGYEKLMGKITFKIDHAIIDEFYGGGINGSKPVQDSIDVTIDHSLVDKYCGGPKVGVMNEGKTVTTHAIGTTFKRFYGGGNGGTSYYREKKQDGNVSFSTPSDSAYWANYGFKTFNPLNTRPGVTTAYQNTGDNKGYHALFEFECFVESNGIGQYPTIRSYLHWAQFGTTSTGDVTNVLDNCTIEGDFFGGGNLANVSGSVTSTLTDCTIKGNAFGGGYSGRIEPFRIHDKTTAKFPYIDKAGVMQDGMNGINSCEYLKNSDNSDRYYTWCYKNASGQMFPKGVVIPSGTNTGAKATFEYDGKWYVLTTVSLEGLGAVSGNASLTLKGNTTVGVNTDPNSGNVFGGGNESVVNGNTTVILEESAHVLGNVYGGGNEAEVGGNSEVKIQNQSKK